MLATGDVHFDILSTYLTTPHIWLVFMVKLVIL